jgi:hypothetical protein
MMHALLAVVLALASAQDAPGKREKRRLEDFNGLLENNIFAPPGAKKDAGGKRKDDPAPAAGRMLSITGFVLSQAGTGYEAVVEDREWSEKDKKFAVREIRFCKEGDALAGGTVSGITVEHMTHVLGEKKTILKVGDQISPDGSSVRTSPVPGEESTAVVDDASREEAAKRRKDRFKKKSLPEETEEEEAAPVRKRRK